MIELGAPRIYRNPDAADTSAGGTLPNGPLPDNGRVLPLDHRVLLTQERLELIKQCMEHVTVRNGLTLVTVNGLDDPKYAELWEMILELETVGPTGGKCSFQEHFYAKDGVVDAITDTQRDDTRDCAGNETRYIFAFKGNELEAGSQLVGEAKIHVDVAQNFPSIAKGSFMEKFEGKIAFLYLWVVDGREANADQIADTVFGECTDFVDRQGDCVLAKDVVVNGPKDLTPSDPKLAAKYNEHGLVQVEGAPLDGYGEGKEHRDVTHFSRTPKGTVVRPDADGVFKVMPK